MRIKLLKICTFIFLVLAVSFKGNAQKEYHNWFIGIGSGMAFTDTGIRVINDTSYNIEGSAAISDSAGNLLFYAGYGIRDRNHNRMPGDSFVYYNADIQQSFVIIPKPGNKNIYYLLLNTNRYSWNVTKRNLYIHTIDMSLNGGLGAILPGADTLCKNITEQLTATKHRNGEDIWLVTHSYATNEFFSYLVTKNGISRTPVISAAGVSPNSLPNRYTGQMKISPNGCWLASTIRQPGHLQIMHFDNSTGKVSGYAYKTTDWPYGIEFSPCSKILYCGSNGFRPLYQYDLTIKGDSNILKSELPCTDSFCAFDLQIGPDRKIYFLAIDRNFFRQKDPLVHHIAVIHNPNQLGFGCNARIDSTRRFKNVKCGLPNNYNMHFKNFASCGPCEVNRKKTVTLCKGDSFYFAKKYLKTAGTYSGDTIPGAECCDTFSTLLLNIVKGDSVLNKTICINDSFMFNDTFRFKPGTYTQHRNSSAGCDSNLVLNLSWFPKLITPFTFDTLLCPKDSLTFNFNALPVKSVLLNNNAIGKTFSLKQIDRYTLTLTDTNGCVVSNKFRISEKNCLPDQLRLSNVFTPFKDGFNDEFDIIIDGETFYNLSIYNRWGALVFKQNSDNAPNWNGRVSNTGAECPEGAYFYEFIYQFSNREKKTLKGTVYLVR